MKNHKVSMDYTEISKNIRNDILESLENANYPRELSDNHIQLLDTFLHDTFLRGRVGIECGLIYFDNDYTLSYHDMSLYINMSYYKSVIEFLESGGFKVIRGIKSIKVSL